MGAKIKRTLYYEEGEQQRTILDERDIASLAQPVVILGDPGIGKSVLAKRLGELPGMKYVRASRFVSHDDPRLLFSGDERPVIDGLDEIASAAPGGAVVEVLKQLSKLGNPSFVLTCRAADWRGAVDRVRLEYHYGVEPVLVHLQPFSEDNAFAFLSSEFPTIDPATVLEHLARYGLEALYKNPLTLKMLGEVMENEGALPETRTALFGRAGRVMLGERNALHQGDTHARSLDEKLLQAAGAICAVHLLCGHIGVHDGPNVETPDGWLNLSELAGLPFGDLTDDALKTRLFVAEGENRFVPIHRVIAEYLGANWLARCFEDGVSEKRIFSLFRPGQGVPTSLRGLHAWLAHFNVVLARRCIEADPYAVLRYGDAETLTLVQARALLAALKGLSEDDPYFRSEDWGQHPVSGLMRPELREEVLAIVEAPNRPAQLRSLLLEAMVGTKLAEQLLPILESITFDRDRDVEERSAVAEALYATGIRDDWNPVIERLVEMSDPESERIAFELLYRVGLFVVPESTSIRTVLAYLGVSPMRTSKDQRFGLRYVPDCLFSNLDMEQLASWLDGLVSTARPSMHNAHFGPREDFARLVRRVATQILETDFEIRPERVWMWIGWLDEDCSGGDDTDERLATVFRENTPFRAALIEHVLLTPCDESVWMLGHRLSELRLGLDPDGQDLVGVLIALRSKAGAGPIDIEVWRDLLMLGRAQDGLPVDLRNAAIECANGDAELLSVVDEMSESHAAEWDARKAERDAEREARRQGVFHAHRRMLAEKLEQVSAGDAHVLSTAAAVYLGRTWALVPQLRFDPELPPQERLRTFLGDVLADLVMGGFVATLHRSDLPSPSRIGKAHSDKKSCVAEAAMICGIAEVLRLGHSLEGIDRATRAATYMALRIGPERDSTEPNPIGEALEESLFHSDADWETHFRIAIEPQLERNSEHPREIYELTQKPRFAELAGRLSLDWLRRYPALNYQVQSTLLPCALKNAPADELRALLIDVRGRTQPDHATELLWLSADYAVDLEDRQRELEAAAADNRDLIWSIRDLIAPRDADSSDRFSLDRLVFIVEVFGEPWPNVPTPTGVTIAGECNPFDASEFIRRTIHAIAGRPSPEATDALQGLIDGHAQSYVDTAKHALALQRRLRRDHEYCSPGIRELRAVVDNGLPESIDDMRAWFADAIEALQKRIRGSDTDMWEAYWHGNEPKEENYCRNRIVEHVGPLPESIRFGPETHMAAGTRVDIAITRNQIKLPVEIKGQWHREVWNAAVDQLDTKYTSDWQAEGRGAYIVLWFGEVPGRLLPRHPDGLPRPGSSEELQRMLIDRLPESLRTLIDVYVIDISKPVAAG